jgi:hypothetical protein
MWLGIRMEMNAPDRKQKNLKEIINKRLEVNEH